MKSDLFVDFMEQNSLYSDWSEEDVSAHNDLIARMSAVTEPFSPSYEVADNVVESEDVSDADDASDWSDSDSESDDEMEDSELPLIEKSVPTAVQEKDSFYDAARGQVVHWNEQLRWQGRPKRPEKPLHHQISEPVTLATLEGPAPVMTVEIDLAQFELNYPPVEPAEVGDFQTSEELEAFPSGAGVEEFVGLPHLGNVLTIRKWHQGCAAVEKRAVCAIIRTTEGRAWMHVRGPASNPEKFRGQYALPGGKVEPGESDDEAIDREIAEEMGVIVTAKCPFFVAFTDQGYAIVHYVAKILGNPVVNDNEKDKIGQWIDGPLDNLRDSKMEGMREAVAAYEQVHGKLPNGLDAWFARGARVPDGYVLALVQNKDRKCLAHAMNINLPVDDHLDINALEERAAGYNPAELLPMLRRPYRVAVFDGDLQVWMGGPPRHVPDIPLYYSRTRAGGHYDGLVARDKMQIAMYPQGGALEEGVKPVGGVPPANGTFVKIINQIALDDAAWQGQVITKLQTRDMVFNTVNVLDNGDAEPNLDTAEALVDWLSNPIPPVLNFRTTIVQDAGTIALEYDVKYGKGSTPTTVFIDTLPGHNKNKWRAAPNVAVMNSSEKESDWIKRLSGLVTAINGNYEADTNNASYRLAKMLTTTQEGGEDGYVHMYARLLRGMVAARTGAFRTMGADSFFNNVGPNAAALQALFGQQGITSPWPAAVSGQTANLGVLFPDPQQLSQILLSFKVPDSNKSWYTFIAYKRIVGTREVETVSNVRSGWTVLANFTRPQLGAAQLGQMGAPGQLPYHSSVHGFPAQSMLCIIAPFEGNDLPAGNNPQHQDNRAIPAGARRAGGPNQPGSLYNLAEYSNPDSWRDAISILISLVGHSDQLAMAMDMVGRDVVNFFPTAFHSLPLPVSEKYIGGDVTEAVVRKRILAMRIQHPNIHTATAGDNQNNLLFNNYIRQWCAAPVGPDLSAGLNVGGPAEADYIAYVNVLLVQCGFAAGPLTAANVAANCAPLAYAAAHHPGGAFERDLFWHQFFLSEGFNHNESVNAIAPLTANPTWADNEVVPVFDNITRALRSMDHTTMTNLRRWLADNHWIDRWPQAAALAAQINLANTTQAIQGLNHAAVPLVNPDTALAGGYFWSRDFSLSPTSLTYNAVEVFPYGIAQLRAVILGFETYHLNERDIAIGRAVQAWNTNTAVDKMLLYSTMIRANADAATAKMGLSTVMVRTLAGDVRTGCDALDTDFERTELYRRGMPTNKAYLTEFVKSQCAMVSINKVANTLMPMIEHGMLQPALCQPRGFGVLAATSTDLDQVAWFCLHFVQYKSLITVEHLAGSPLAEKLDILNAALPGSDVPWSGWEVNTAAMVPNELMGAMRVAAMLDGKALPITQTKEARLIRGVGNVKQYHIETYYQKNAPIPSFAVMPFRYFAVDFYYLLASPYSWNYRWGLGYNDNRELPRVSMFDITDTSFYSAIPGAGVPGYVNGNELTEIAQIPAGESKVRKTVHGLIAFAVAGNNYVVRVASNALQFQGYTRCTYGKGNLLQNQAGFTNANTGYGERIEPQTTILMGGQEGGYSLAVRGQVRFPGLVNATNVVQGGAAPAPWPAGVAAEGTPLNRNTFAYLGLVKRVYGQANAGNAEDLSLTEWWQRYWNRMMTRLHRVAAKVTYEARPMWVGINRLKVNVDVNAVMGAQAAIPQQNIHGLGQLIGANAVRQAVFPQALVGEYLMINDKKVELVKQPEANRQQAPDGPVGAGAKEEAEKLEKRKAAIVEEEEKLQIKLKAFEKDLAKLNEALVKVAKKAKAQKEAEKKKGKGADEIIEPQLPLGEPVPHVQPFRQADAQVLVPPAPLQMQGADARVPLPILRQPARPVSPPAPLSPPVEPRHLAQLPGVHWSDEAKARARDGAMKNGMNVDEMFKLLENEPLFE